MLALIDLADGIIGAIASGFTLAFAVGARALTLAVIVIVAQAWALLVFALIDVAKSSQRAGDKAGSCN